MFPEGTVKGTYSRSILRILIPAVGASWRRVSDRDSRGTLLWPGSRMHQSVSGSGYEPALQGLCWDWW